MSPTRHNKFVLMFDFSFLKDANFNTVLELAVRFGKTLIIQEADTVEPVLYPLLRGDLISQGRSFFVVPFMGVKYRAIKLL